MAIVLIFNHSWSEMRVFDVLTTLQLLVSNIYVGVMRDNVVLIIFDVRMDKFAKFSSS